MNNENRKKMAYYWKIPFVDADGVSYEVRVERPAGATRDVVLEGSTEPMVTEEDDDDFFFKPVRTQSGYIGIVDSMTSDGAVHAFDWHDLIPTDVTDRPVVLWNIDDNEAMWYGYMQPQTFQGAFQVAPQTRKFPIACPLSVLKGVNMSIPSGMDMVSVAWLLNEILTVKMPASFADVLGYVYIQGTDAAGSGGWLSQLVSRGLFYETAEGGYDRPKYDALEMLGHVCRFFGLTCRVHRADIWLVSAAMEVAGGMPAFTRISAAELAKAAQGLSYSTDDIGWDDEALTDGVFVDTDNEEMVLLGANKVTVSEDVGHFDWVLELPTQEIVDFGVKDVGESAEHGLIYASGRQGTCGWYLRSVWNGLTTDFKFKNIDINMANGGLLLLSDYDDGAWSDATGGTLQKHTYNWRALMRVPYKSTDTLVATLTGKQAVALSDGVLVLHVDTLIDVVPSSGHKQWNGYGTLYMSIRVGDKYWHSNVAKWMDSEYICWVPVGGTETKEGQGTIANTRDLSGWWPSSGISPKYGPYPPYSGWSIPVYEALCGVVELKIYGCLIANPQTVFGTSTLTDTYIDVVGLSFDFLRGTEYDDWSDNERNTYTHSNGGVFTEEVQVDNILTCDQHNAPGSGILISPDGGYAKTLPFDGVDLVPGQRLADQMGQYYSRTRTMLKLGLLTSAYWLSPGKRLTWNGGTYYPMCFARNWYDNKETVKLVEV